MRLAGASARLSVGIGTFGSSSMVGMRCRLTRSTGRGSAAVGEGSTAPQSRPERALSQRSLVHQPAAGCCSQRPQLAARWMPWPHCQMLLPRARARSCVFSPISCTPLVVDSAMACAWAAISRVCADAAWACAWAASTALRDSWRSALTASPARRCASSESTLASEGSEPGTSMSGSELRTACSTSRDTLRASLTVWRAPSVALLEVVSMKDAAREAQSTQPGKGRTPNSSHSAAQKLRTLR
mmetsp:Transcript_64317/g.182645  ORF Transcript_64317/g.182645 Transcript_64317/m.182645 type:complete len:242 (-) Transcript_64317:502-1227(-)